jgi:hypothetical protein
LDDVVGPGFTLLVRGAAAPELDSDAMGALNRFGVGLFQLDAAFDIGGAYTAWFDANACDAVLIRPDRAVFGAAAGADAAATLLRALAAAA